MMANPISVSETGLVHSWWFGRFELSITDNMVHFRDKLVPPGRKLPLAEFADLSGADLLVAYFRLGFLRPALGAVPYQVRNRPRDSDDGIFWQYPGRTEAAAWDLHAALPTAGFDGLAVHVYVGMPWATWIDKLQKARWSKRGQASMLEQIRFLTVRLSGYRRMLASIGMGMRIHTVCQHISWRNLLKIWAQIGVTDLWLSHCESNVSRVSEPSPRLHPWRLYAVNIEDQTRRDGLQVERDPAAKPVLTSFIGANAPHYISDIRQRLLSLAGEPDVVIRLRDEWHFERVVYREQVSGSIGDNMPVEEAAAVREYNWLLSDSRFVLCPAGAGPNTLRLWEALAVGAVPVLLGPPPELPSGGSLQAIDWEAIVVREPGENLSSLLQRLRSMPIDEVRRRSQLARRAFKLVQCQTCFG